MKNYKKPSTICWKGRSDGSNALRLHEVIKLVDLTKPFPEKLRGIGFIGFASDEGIRRNFGRVGAAKGPNVLRSKLANLPLPNIDANYFDFGTICCHEEDLEESQEQLSLMVQTLLENHIFPIILGGGHDVSWAHYQGLAKSNPNKKISIVNFDAHFDLRPFSENKGNSGTSFSQIAKFTEEEDLPFKYYCLGIQQMSNTEIMFKTADRLGVKYFLADHFHMGSPELPLEFIEETLLHNEAIYLTICLDVFAAAFAPGVSAPQSLGLLPWHVIPLLQRLAASGKVIGMDIAELSPPYDIDGRTAHLAAGLIYHFLRNV